MASNKAAKQRNKIKTELAFCCWKVPGGQGGSVLCPSSHFSLQPFPRVSRRCFVECLGAGGCFVVDPETVGSGDPPLPC